MFEFLLAQWKLGRLNEEKLERAVARALITLDQAETIRNTPIVTEVI